jgi:hypothetical protein
VSRKRPRHSTTNKKRESFESDDVCYNCDDGGGKLVVSDHISSLLLLLLTVVVCQLFQNWFFAIFARRLSILTAIFRNFMSSHQENGGAASVLRSCSRGNYVVAVVTLVSDQMLAGNALPVKPSNALGVLLSGVESSVN